MQKFALDEQVVLKLISDAVRDKSLKPRFGIKTEAILNGYLNEWQNSWMELPAKVEDEHGHEINASQPDQVEVVYERVRFEH
jgi:hypothetical protein